MSPFAAGLIWLLSWECIKSLIDQNKNDITPATYIFMFVGDMIIWPFALILTSKVILEEEHV